MSGGSDFSLQILRWSAAWGERGVTCGEVTGGEVASDRWLGDRWLGDR